MKKNHQHGTLSTENETSNEVNFENIVDVFAFMESRAHIFASVSGSNMTWHGSPLGKAEDRFED